MRPSFPRIILILLLVPVCLFAYQLHAHRSATVTTRTAPRSPVIWTSLPPEAQAAQTFTDLDGLYASVVEQEVAVYLAAVAEAQRAAEAAQRASQTQGGGVRAVGGTSWPVSLYPCGGDLPPCYVKQRESGGDYSARNPSSSASGAWQILDSTWAGYGGYPSAYLAPPDVQDERARQLWAGGAGCGHWSAC